MATFRVQPKGIKHMRYKAVGVDAAIGQRLQRHRMRVGMSQEALGERMGLSFQQIQKYEKGINRITIGAMLTMADALNIDPSVLYEGLNRSTTKTELPALSQQAIEVALIYDTVPTGPRKAIRSLVLTLTGADADA